MRASIVIAAHNEGEHLWRTVKSCVDTTRGLKYEVVVVDDASTDDCVGELLRRFPRVSVVTHRERRGTSPSKDHGARCSRGRVIVFLDGHCKPERGAIARLVKDVEERAGNAIFIPRIPALDCAAWKNSKLQVGHGFGFTLEDFACDWMPRERMWLRGRFYESPSLVGCCLAVGRRLYEKVRGFDRHMLQWGVEDLDFSLRAWLMGHPILYDPEAVIGHRFRKTFDTFTVTEECVLVNKLRMARKNFTDAVWRDWLRRARAREPAKRWRKAWTLFQAGKESVERERRYLLRHRVEDEFWYARRFGLNWPKEARGHRGRSPSSR